MKPPEKGFYYHYKHSSDSLYDHAYEVMGVAVSTENIAERVVIYRPLYEDSFAWKEGGLSWIRPLEMFVETVTKEGNTFPRFTKIADPKIIAELEHVRDSMYP